MGVSGEAVVSEPGQHGLLSIYRDDPYTHELDGALANELIRFLVDGQPATVANGAIPRWTANGDLIEVDLTVNRSDVSREMIYLPLIRK